jgi:putative glutamine amidotransferase
VSVTAVAVVASGVAEVRVVRPVIGITAGFDVAPNVLPRCERLTLLAPYTDAIYAAGGFPYPLAPPPQCDAALLDELLGHVDGVLFTGGPDLDPANYGQAPHPETHILHPRRDLFELACFRRADQAQKPILAICLGFQVAHVARGGRLIQHVDDRNSTSAVTHRLPDNSALHPVRIEPDSGLATVVGGTELEVNSRHHQAVDPAYQGRGLRPVAFAPDGLVEASEDRNPPFLLAVQWHPENMTDRRPHRALFEALVAAARG